MDNRTNVVHLYRVSLCGAILVHVMHILTRVSALGMYHLQNS